MSIKYRNLNVLSLTALFALLSGPMPFATLANEADDDKSRPQQAKTSAQQPKLVYRPPLRGAPTTRVGAGTRGQGLSGPVLYVITPEHTGLTTQAQPELYWYVSEPAAVRFEFALIDNDGLSTVIETSLEKMPGAGIHKIALQDHDVALKPGLEYQWIVALVRNNEQRSEDIVASGTIKHVVANSELSKLLSESDEARQKVHAYAEQGIWYDAFALLIELINKYPNDQELKDMRTSLLQQAGLQDLSMTSL